MSTSLAAGAGGPSAERRIRRDDVEGCAYTARAGAARRHHGYRGPWFQAENFAEIEHFADEARAKNLRTASGLWVIGLVYSGIDSIANYRKVKDDAGWDQLEGTAKRWIAAYPASVTAKIAYAGILQNRAWFYRGGVDTQAPSPKNNSMRSTGR